MKTKIKTLVFLLVISSLTFTACKKKDDEQSSEQTKSHLNPPSWIQHTWTKPNGMNGEDGFKFTTNDMITVMFDKNGNQTANISLMETIKSKDYSLTQQAASDSYQFTIHYNSSNSSEKYQFKLTAAGELVYTDNIQNTFTYTKRN